MSDPICTYNKKENEHIWTCLGDDAALHLCIFKSPTEYTGRDWQGGLEEHRRSPPSYRASDSLPDHVDCWLLKGPCWHDGTSLYVSEFVIPFWLNDSNNIERMYKLLRREYRKRFEEG